MFGFQILFPNNPILFVQMPKIDGKVFIAQLEEILVIHGIYRRIRNRNVIDMTDFNFRFPFNLITY